LITQSTYLITASSGIGAATARKLASAESRFYLISRDGKTGQELAAELKDRGCPAVFHEGDLTDPAVAPAAVKDCVKHFGGIDALFNVAGISGRRFGDGPIHECTEEGWEITLQTNATTQYRMSREVVKVMLEQQPGADGQRGVILNMSSILAIDPDARHFSTVAYAASKGAVIAMSRTMAACYASQRIRVNVIAPGLVRTPMSARASDEPAIVSYMKYRQPLIEDVISVEDVAATCVHLLTDASRATTGQVVQVDGGWGVA
jgi:NAD(P)-dependent dehydrogenase (short-subunit alcohol dehydrogenase family)